MKNFGENMAKVCPYCQSQAVEFLDVRNNLADLAEVSVWLCSECYALFYQDAKTGQLINIGGAETEPHKGNGYARALLNLVKLADDGHLGYVFICLAVKSEAKAVANMELEKIAARNALYNLRHPAEWQYLAKKICRLFQATELVDDGLLNIFEPKSLHHSQPNHVIAHQVDELLIAAQLTPDYNQADQALNKAQKLLEEAIPAGREILRFLRITNLDNMNNSLKDDTLKPERLS